MNEILSFLRTLPRIELLRRIRVAANDDRIVFWEQIAYSDMYEKVIAGPETAATLGVPIGAVIGYRILAGTPMGGALADLINIEPQNESPDPDPFR
jgi:hypothetical protein